jgi:hypothetical protein
MNPGVAMTVGLGVREGVQTGPGAVRGQPIGSMSELLKKGCLTAISSAAAVWAVISAPVPFGRAWDSFAGLRFR